MKRSFTVVVERDPVSTWLVGDVVELPGCYSQASDLRTLETNMQEAIRAYLRTVEPDEPLPDFVPDLPAPLSLPKLKFRSH